MRLLTAAGVLILSTGPALGAYLVDMDGGDQMTVDSYWADGNQMHLMQGGVDLIVPRSRVRGVKETSGGTASAPTPAARPAREEPAPRAAASTGPQPAEELKAQQRRIEHHLLRVQQERFESKNRNDPPAKQKRLEKEFARTQQRRMGVLRELAER